MRSNKFIVVSGGSGSIGREIVKFLLKKKYKIINIDKSKLNLRNVNNIICDLDDIDLLKEKIKILENKNFKKIFAFIHCAGTTIPGKSIDYNLNDWVKTLNVNLTSAFLISQKIAKIIRKSNINGSIINITSISANLAIPDSSAYNVSKAGLKQLTKSLALDFAKYKIRVNCLSPGYTKSKMTKKSWKNKNLRRKRDNRMILNRWAEANDYNQAILFMLENSQSGYMTGSEILIDGGWSAKGL